MIDSGAGISLIPQRWYDAIPDNEKPLLRPTTLNVKTGNKIKINVAGYIEVSLKLQCGVYPCNFHVSCDEIHGILGMDFMERHRVNFQAADKKCFIGNRPVPVYNKAGARLNHRIVCTETIYVPPQQRCIVPGKVTGYGEIEEQDVLIEGDRALFANSGILASRVMAVPRHNIVPMEVMNMTDECRTIAKGTELGTVVDTEEMCNYDSTDDTTSAGGQAQHCEKQHVQVNTIMVSELAGGKKVPLRPPDDDIGLPAHVCELYSRYVGDMCHDDRAYFHVLLNEHADVFARDKTDLGRTDWVQHHIDTGDETPFKQRAYRLPQMKYEEMKKQVMTLAEKGIIRPSTSNWASNVLLVRKKDKTWRMCIDYRELNRRTKNVDPYLMPRIDDTLDQLGTAKFFCTLDLIAGYHQVELTEESKPKTAFTTPRMNPSQWEYNMMPFGVQGGPATFQRLMDKLLVGLDYRIALAYLDDIIVYGSTRLECMQRLATVFQRLRAAGLKLKPSKCTLFEPETLYLGHIVSAEGIKCDPKKVEAVKNWVRPNNYRDVQVFLGTVNYYNRFIKDFSKIAHPLRKIPKDKRLFEWTIECEEAFQTLKGALVTAPVMAYPQAEGLYILDTDASAFAIGGVLAQMQTSTDGDPQERVIAYSSRSLQGREQRYCTRRRELLAIVDAVKRFKAYLWGREVKIRTDHASLKYIKTQNNPDDQFARWVERLEEMYYTIEIRKGVKHCNADGLSRLQSDTCAGKRCICPGVAALEATGDVDDDWQCLSRDNAQHVYAREADSSSEGVHSDTEYEDSVEINAFSFTKSWIADEIAAAQEADPDVGPVYSAKARGTGKPAPNDYSAESAETKAYMHDWERLQLKINNVLYRRWESDDGTETRNQILLPYQYREDVYEHLHESRIACHMGRRRTLHRMQKHYYWYRMADDIKLWIKTCEVCQLRKRAGKPAKAPLTIYLAGAPNERVALDVLGPLARSTSGNKCILVITDHFTKYTKAVAMPDQKAPTVAAAFDREWISVFGTPRTVHSDQGSNFESTIFQEMCKMLQISKSRTTSYHPQGNSQCERFNSTLLSMIHAHARDHPKDWDANLHHVVLFYNATKHASTDIEPNRLMFGRNVEMPLDVTMPEDPNVQPISPSAHVRKMERALRTAYHYTREHLKRASTAQKKYYDKNCNLYKYKEGDMVKLRKFRREPGTGKYADRYEGPYYIMDILGDVTFRIVENQKKPPKVVHHDHILPYFPKKASENVDKTWVLERSKTYKPTTVSDVACQASDTASARPQGNAASRPATVPQAQLDVETEIVSTDTPVLAHVDDNSAGAGADEQQPPCRKRVKITAVDLSDALEIQQRKRGRPRKAKATSDLPDERDEKAPRLIDTES